MIYLIIGIFIIFLTYLEALAKPKFSSKTVLGILSFVLVLFAGLRDKVGTDWAAYYDFYQFGTDRVEIGYATLNNFFSGLGLNYNLFLILLNTLSLCLMFQFFNRNTKYSVLALLIFFSDFFLYFNLSGIRQAIAISITCYSINFALERKKMQFFLLIFIAILFHFSSLIFIFAYFISKKILNIKQFLMYLLFFTIGTILLNYISDFITMYTMKNADVYVNYQEKAQNLQSLFYIGIAKRFIIIVLILKFGRKLFEYENFTYFFNLYLFGFAIYLSTYMVSPDIGVRMSSYFTIVDTVLAGAILFVNKNLNVRILIISIFSLISIYKLVGYMDDIYFKYNSIF